MIAFPLIATCLLATLHPVVVLAQTELITAYSTQYLLSTIVDPISSTAVATTNSTIISHAVTQTHVVPQFSSIVSIMTLTEEPKLIGMSVHKQKQKLKRKQKLRLKPIHILKLRHQIRFR